MALIALAGTRDAWGYPKYIEIRSERDLELYTQEHLDLLSQGLRVIGRQVRLPHGRLDLMAYKENALWLIEFKLGTIYGQAVTQVLRYKYDIAEGLRNLCRDIDFADYLCDLALYPVLVGGAASENALCAASAAHVGIYTYTIHELDTITGFALSTPPANPSAHQSWSSDLLRVMGWVPKQQAITEKEQGRRESIAALMERCLALPGLM